MFPDGFVVGSVEVATAMVHVFFFFFFFLPAHVDPLWRRLFASQPVHVEEPPEDSGLGGGGMDDDDEDSDVVVVSQLA